MLALAPDASSVKAGQGLATPTKWISVHHHKSVLWGECKGSGSTPYRTQIDLSEPAFKCSCPSRKFPCKHGIGLFLIYVTTINKFVDAPPPGWVLQWFESRKKKSENTTEKKPVNAKTQAKRVADRESKITAGLAETELWLRDIIRNGLSSLDNQPASFWERAISRMIDAQAPGIARMIRKAANIPLIDENSQIRLLEKLSKIYLAIEGYKNINDLTPATQADIKSVIGWTVNQDELLQSEGLRDRWKVLGKYENEEDKIKIQRTWLYGDTSGKFALILSFAAAKQSLDMSLLIDTIIDAEIVFYPGAYPLRGLIKERHSSPESMNGYPPGYGIPEIFDTYANATSQNIWIDSIPVMLTSVIPFYNSDDKGILSDSDGYSLNIRDGFDYQWELLAISGGRGLSIFGEWDGESFLPLSVQGKNQILYMY